MSAQYNKYSNDGYTWGKHYNVRGVALVQVDKDELYRRIQGAGYRYISSLAREIGLHPDYIGNTLSRYNNRLPETVLNMIEEKLSEVNNPINSAPIKTIKTIREANKDDLYNAVYQSVYKATSKVFKEE